MFVSLCEIVSGFESVNILRVYVSHRRLRRSVSSAWVGVLSSLSLQRTDSDIINDGLQLDCCSSHFTRMGFRWNCSAHRVA